MCRYIYLHIKLIKTFSKANRKKGNEDPDYSARTSWYIYQLKWAIITMPRGRKPKLQTASPAILRHFDQMDKRVFKAQELARILDEQRELSASVRNGKPAR